MRACVVMVGCDVSDIGIFDVALQKPFGNVVYVRKGTGFVFQTRLIFPAHFFRGFVVGQKKIHKTPLWQYIVFSGQKVQIRINALQRTIDNYPIRFESCKVMIFTRTLSRKR